MASCLTELAKPLQERAINSAISETSYVCCFKCIVEDFNKKKEELKVKNKAVEQRLEVIKRRAEDIPIELTDLKNKINEIIEEDTETKMTCFFGWCPNCKGRYLKGKKLEAIMTKDIGSLLEFNIEDVGLAPHPLGAGYYSSLNYISFQGRKEKEDELVRALTDANSYITGLIGMGGTGKTTLAKEVGKKLEGSKCFDYVIDTTVSYTPDIKKIQDDLAARLGLKLEDCTEPERPLKLFSRLTNGDKILIILDDVWKKEEEKVISFEEIGIPYRDNNKGCKILITTREMHVCELMGCESRIQLDLLSKDDAWMLFMKHVDISGKLSKDLLDKGKKIVKECKGLPVAIAAIAATLKGQQSREKWKATLTSLRNPMSVHGVPKDIIEVYKCLRYSYDNNKNDNAKKLFLLCSVFQEDEEIDYEILNRLAIGAGLLDKVYEKYDDARDQVVVAKNNLIDSCLLLKDEYDNVKMHDLVREVGLWIAEKTIQSINLSNKNQKSSLGREENVKYMLCEGESVDVFSFRFDGYKIEVLIVYIHGYEEEDNSTQVSDSFFENMTSLQVLYLYKMEGPRLYLSFPRSNLELTNIRSLIFERVHLSDIFILGSLRTLETLDFVHSTIMELPHDITELERLKLLKLYQCDITKKSNPFEVIARCTSLEELYFEDVDVDYLLVDPEAEVIHQDTTFPTLGRFRLTENDESNSPKCVCLPNIDRLISEATMKYLMKRAQVLRLDGIKKEWINVVPEMIPMDAGTKYLCELNLKSCQNLQYLIDTKNVDHSSLQNLFSMLVTLHLEDMNNLEELCSGPLPIDLLKSLENLQIERCVNLQGHLFKSKVNPFKLKTISITSCPRLESLFLLSTCQSLVMLEKLEIDECEKLRNIIRDERTEEKTDDEIVDADDGNKSCGGIFPKLKTLSIGSCPQLRFILPFLSASDVPLLETIEIGDCGEMKFLFGQYQRHHEQKEKDDVLIYLKEMILNKLPNFIDIFPGEYNTSMKKPFVGDSYEGKIPLESNQRNFFPWTHMRCCYGRRKNKQKLTVTSTTNNPLASKNQQQEDFSILSLSNSEDIHIWEPAHCLSKQSQILRHIKIIKLYNLPKKKSIFNLSLTPIMMLETLIIQSCQELKQVLVIDIKDDHNRLNWGDVFPRLKYLMVHHCLELEYVFGEYPDVHNNHDDILIHLRALESINLNSLSNLINICSEGYHTSFPALKTVQLENTTSKMNFGLRKVNLYELLVGGHKGSFTPQNLKKLIIKGCERLEVIFPISISKCLPKLLYMSIIECKELKHIIEEDVKNEEQTSSNIVCAMTCFPKLEALIVRKCNKLKYILHVSTFKELPPLSNLLITEASNLEKVFRCEHGNDQKVKLPNLKYVLLAHLPNMYQEIELQTIQGHVVQNCPKLSSSTSSLTSTLDALALLIRRDFEMFWKDWKYEFLSSIDDLKENISKTTSLELPPSQIITDQLENDSIESNDFNSTEIKMQRTPSTKNLPTDSEIESHLIEETKDHNAQEDSTSVPVSSTHSETRITLLSEKVSSSQLEPTQARSASSSQLKPAQSTSANIIEETKDHINAHEGSTSMAVSSTDSETRITSLPSLHQENGSDQKTITCISPTISSLLSIPQNKIESHNLEGTKDHCSQEQGSTSMTKLTSILSTDSQTRTTSLIPLQQGIKKSAGTTSEKEGIIKESTESSDKLMTFDPSSTKGRDGIILQKGQVIITSPIDVESVSPSSEQPMTPNPLENGDSRKPMPSISAPIGVKDSLIETADCLVALTQTLHIDDYTSGKIDLTFEEQSSYVQKSMPSSSATAVHHTTKDVGVKDYLETYEEASGKILLTRSEEKSFLGDGIGVSKFKHSFVALQSPSMATNIKSSKGNVSQTEENSSLATQITCELEQLVSNKYLAQENLPLLMDAFVKHPNIRLVDNEHRLSIKSKGYAYSCLSELLKFLQTHSALDVLESRRYEFAELMKDVRVYPFDQDWLDDVERRALSPNLPISRDAWQELLHSKQHVTQKVEELHLKVEISTHHLEDLKHQLASSEAILESIVQQEAQVLEARAVLSAPLGY